MLLETPELVELAGFCARRFPDPTVRAGLAARAGLADDDWEPLLARAHATGRLAALLRVLAGAAPGDENLRAAAAIFAPRPSRRAGLFVAVGVAGLLGSTVIAGGAVALAAAGAETARSQAGAPEEIALVAEAGVGEGAEAPTAPPDAAVEPRPPVEATVPPAAELPVEKEAPPEPRPDDETFGCSGEHGEILGYWYAGADDPGALVRLEADARVRADYPRRDNGHNARASERCVLPRGTRLRLTSPAIHVDGDRWWVPFTAGDVVPA